MFKKYRWLTLCVIVWGSNFIFGKILVQSFSPALLTSLRLLFIVLLLLGIASYRTFLRRITVRDWLFVILLGIVGVFINQWSFFKGLVTADTTTSALVLATTPIFTGFLAAIFLKEKVTLRMLGGSLVAIVGIFFVVTKGSFISIDIDKGLLWIVLTMMSFAFMIIMTRLLSKQIDPVTLTLYSNIVGFIVSIPFIFIWDKPIRIGVSLGDWALLIGTAVIVHGIATLVWNQNIRYVNASKASILSNLEPFVAMIVGFMLLAKPVTAIEITGSMFIIGGVIFATYQKKKNEILS